MKRGVFVLSILLAALVMAALAGCGGAQETASSGPAASSAATTVQPAGDTDAGAATTENAPATTQSEQATTENGSSTTEAGKGPWTIYINDDDSFTDGDVTYSIALNLTATNPGAEEYGTYTGTATAKTDVNGTVEGLPLNASSIVNSEKLEFTLEDPLAGGALAPLTPNGSEDLTYSGSGTIVMKASGSGSIGPAGGGFQNTSGQTINVKVEGSVATLTVAIEGHTYTFQGTISGA